MIKLPKPQLSVANQVCLSIGLFAAAALAAGARMPWWEEGLFWAIYGLPDLLLPLFLIITQAGSVFMFAGLAVAYLIARQYHLTLKLLLGGSLAYLLAGLAKDVLGRGRPLELINDVVARELTAYGAGFPSGHTALATAIALTMSPHLPKRYRWTVPVVIVLVGLSRVYLGVHAPLDIVGGLAIGWFSASLFRQVVIRDRAPKTSNRKALKKT